jgi:hypothetical protein
MICCRKSEESVFVIRCSIRGEISGDLGDIIGDVADTLAAELGIKQWYSMHLMNMCEGTYTPNATASGTQLNVSACTSPTAMCTMCM